MTQVSPHVARLFTFPLDGQNIMTLQAIFLNELGGATADVLENDPTLDRNQEGYKAFGEALLKELLERLGESAAGIAQALQATAQE